MLQLFRRNDSDNYENVLNNFLARFYSEESHNWILNDRYIKANFDDFFEKLSKDHLKIFLKDQRLLFLPSSGKFSCTFQTMNDFIVIVFPELMSLLRSSASNHASAILAHELGHIIHSHSRKDIDPIKAQVEADAFACELGFADELETFLMDQQDSLEKKIRLTYVTSFIFSSMK